MEPILQDWEDFARSIQPPQRSMDVAELRDHAQEMLEEIAAELAAAETQSAGGMTPDGPAPDDEPSAAEIHAETRLKSGFNIEQLVSEYRALRASVLRLWLQRVKTEEWFELEDMGKFNEAIDRALADSVSRYSDMVNRSQDIFLGILGHDLRTPLQSLSMGAAFLMQLETADSNLIQLGSRMYNSTTRMMHILDNLLDFTMSRVGGGLPMHPKHADLADVAAQVADEFRFSNPMRAIKSEASGDTEGVWDASRIGQVYQNLIGNALQYGAKDGVVSVLTQGFHDHVTIVVHNDGEPIPPHKRQNLFDPLHRLSTAGDEHPGRRNLGLGLYIVYEIVAAHQGTVNVASLPGKGTTFTVKLPK